MVTHNWSAGSSFGFLVQETHGHTSVNAANDHEDDKMINGLEYLTEEEKLRELGETERQEKVQGGS